MKQQKARLTTHTSKDLIPATLHSLIHESFLAATSSTNVGDGAGTGAGTGTGSFYIALSGGSLPSFLRSLPQSFVDAGIDPQWNKWHVLLADERLVPSTHDDSNLGAVKKSFLASVMPMIPSEQIYGIDESLLEEDTTDTSAMASEYQRRVFGPILSEEEHGDENKKMRKPFLVDCALLGFGPDGHTCSLFPNHKLVVHQGGVGGSKSESKLLVAGIDDSPKPPPKRITLTLLTLNEYTRDVIFVGAGESKCEILKDVFDRVSLVNMRNTCTIGSGSSTNSSEVLEYDVAMNPSTVYPCGMIRPVSDSLHYVTDTDATKSLTVNKRIGCAML